MSMLSEVKTNGQPVARAWRATGAWPFLLALDEIAALAGLATNRPKRPPVPERYALQAAAMVATVRKGAP